jgi:hypothetical protein
VNAIDKVEKLGENGCQRVAFVFGSRTDQARSVAVWYPALACVVHVEQSGIDAMLKQRQMRRVLEIVANVALVIVHCFAQLCTVRE